MTMDIGYRAVLSACIVAVVLMAARLFGQKAAGTVAGLPLLSGPALWWMVGAQGPAFAAQAAVGCVTSCAMAAALAFGYERAARRWGPAGAAACGLGCAGLAGVAAHAASLELGAALLVAWVVSLAVLRAMPRQADGSVVARRLGAEPVLTAALAGGVSALAGLAAPWLGAFGAGLVASLPLVCITAAVFNHLTGGHAAVATLLRGYVSGIAATAVFGAVFGGLVVAGGAVLALAAATLACGSVLAAASTLAGMRQRVLDEGFQLGGLLPTAGVVQVEAGKRR